MAAAKVVAIREESQAVVRLEGVVVKAEVKPEGAVVNAANSTVERAEAVVEAVTVGVVATATVELTGAEYRVRAVVATAEVVAAVGRMAQAAKRGGRGAGTTPPLPKAQRGQSAALTTSTMQRWRQM